MRPTRQLDAQFKEIRIENRNYISSKETVVTAENAKSLFVIQSLRESDDHFLVRFSEQVQCCNFKKYK